MIAKDLNTSNRRFLSILLKVLKAQRVRKFYLVFITLEHGVLKIWSFIRDAADLILSYEISYPCPGFDLSVPFSIMVYKKH